MQKIASLTLCCASLLSGCTIRAVALIETEDAVYGTTKIEKVQKYDSKQRHLGFFESLMGALNADTIDALGRVVNGSTTSTLSPIEKSATITPLPSGASVVVQP